MEDRDELLALIGQRITQRRASLGLSLDQVAALCDVSRAMVSRIERGEVHASAVVLDRLCAGLGLTLSELFARETPSPLARRAEQPVWRGPVQSIICAARSTPAAIRLARTDRRDRISAKRRGDVRAPSPTGSASSMSWC